MMYGLVFWLSIKKKTTLAERAVYNKRFEPTTLHLIQSFALISYDLPESLKL